MQFSRQIVECITWFCRSLFDRPWLLSLHVNGSISGMTGAPRLLALNELWRLEVIVVDSKVNDFAEITLLGRCGVKRLGSGEGRCL